MLEEKTPHPDPLPANPGRGNDMKTSFERNRMLVLARIRGEEILIGDEITIKVVKLGEGRVALGIEAPRHLKIVRKELVTPEEATQASGELIEIPESWLNSLDISLVQASFLGLPEAEAA
jgi:carbon storage regulator